MSRSTPGRGVRPTFPFGPPSFGRSISDRWPNGSSWSAEVSDDSAPWVGMGRAMGLLFIAAFAFACVVPLFALSAFAVSRGGLTTAVLVAGFWILGALVVFVAVRALVRRVSPVVDLISAAGRLADGDYTTRVDEEVPSPVQAAVTSFNRMAEQLESSEDRRRRLLADINHELRTPLTIVRGELEAIADGVHEPTAERIGGMLTDVAVIERLLDDLRTLSNSESGVLALHLEVVDMNRLVEEVVDRLRTQSASADHALQVSSSKEPIIAFVDPVRLREVLTNLLTNSLRAIGPNGRIDIAIATHLDDEPPSFSVTVCDDGIGMGPDELDRVFDRFQKGTRSHGSGLGLTISRQLVEAHGGAISLRSERAGGTVATVRIPISLDASEPSTPNPTLRDPATT